MTTSSHTASECSALCGLLVAALSPAAIYKVEYLLPDTAGVNMRCSLIVLLPNGAPKAIAGHEPVLQLTRRESGHRWARLCCTSL